MIIHFVSRDFQDNRLGWIFVVAITILALLGFVAGQQRIAVWVLLYAYMMFGMSPIHEILGSVWRTQHQISRHYLLSLPIPHTKLFLIQQLRIVVFCIPFILLSIALPFVWYENASQSAPRRILYFYNIAVSVGLFVHAWIWMALEMERVASYIPRKERLWIHLKSTVILIALFSVPSFVWQDFFGTFGNSATLRTMTLYCLAFMTVSLVVLFFLNRSKWCVTRAKVGNRR